MNVYQKVGPVIFVEAGLIPIMGDEPFAPDPSAMVETAKNVIRSEINALHTLLEAVDDNLEQAARLIQQTQGRVVVTGVGKSGHIGRKIAATLASTGTPALFMHATEGVHGDLGMITAADIVLLISYSGRTEETLNLIRPIRQIGAKLIAMTGRQHSPLAQNADVTLEIGVSEEADPLGLAPTNSTIAMLALGDALAVTLSVDRKFTREDFGKFHPGGNLGKQLQRDTKEI
jgi:arabinose-5-phosphate isomerase